MINKNTCRRKSYFFYNEFPYNYL